MLVAEIYHLHCGSGVDQRELSSLAYVLQRVKMVMHLDLVSVEFDSLFKCFLHVLCVEVAQTQTLDSAVLLEVIQGIKIMGVIVLEG
jgi:hypothetical protein